jgi:hypothetical protein
VCFRLDFRNNQTTMYVFNICIAFVCGHATSYDHGPKSCFYAPVIHSSHLGTMQIILICRGPRTLPPCSRRFYWRLRTALDGDWYLGHYEHSNSHPPFEGRNSGVVIKFEFSLYVFHSSIEFHVLWFSYIDLW